MKLTRADGSTIDAEVSRTLTNEGEDWTIESRGGGADNPRNPEYAEAFVRILELAKGERLTLRRAYIDTLVGDAAKAPLEDRVIPTDRTLPVQLSQVSDLDALRLDIVTNGMKVLSKASVGGNPNRRITLEFSR